MLQKIIYFVSCLLGVFTNGALALYSVAFNNLEESGTWMCIAVSMLSVSLFTFASVKTYQNIGRPS